MIDTLQTHTIDISIHALFAEGDLDGKRPGHTVEISIHALFAEGDVFQLLGLLGLVISIHALFAEGDTTSTVLSPCPSGFLSTPSSQRATRTDRSSKTRHDYFYPRPLRRGRPKLAGVAQALYQISIHALFAEGDLSDEDTAKK